MTLGARWDAVAARKTCALQLVRGAKRARRCSPRSAGPPKPSPRRLATAAAAVGDRGGGGGGSCRRWWRHVPPRCRTKEVGAHERARPPPRPPAPAAPRLVAVARGRAVPLRNRVAVAPTPVTAGYSRGWSRGGRGGELAFQRHQEGPALPAAGASAAWSGCRRVSRLTGQPIWTPMCRHRRRRRGRKMDDTVLDEENAGRFANRPAVGERCEP